MPFCTDKNGASEFDIIGFFSNVAVFENVDSPPICTFAFSGKLCASESSCPLMINEVHCIFSIFPCGVVIFAGDITVLTSSTLPSILSVINVMVSVELGLSVTVHFELIGLLSNCILYHR